MCKIKHYKLKKIQKNIIFFFLTLPRPPTFNTSFVPDEEGFIGLRTLYL